MAITVTIFYTGEGENAQKFVQEMVKTGIVKRIKEEKGNLAYNYYLSMSDPHTVLLLDSWEDQKALDIHHASPMMEEIMQLRDKYNLTMKAERYISDQEGFTENDKKFITQN